MPKAAPMFNAKPKAKSNWDSWQAKKGNDRDRGYGWAWRKLTKRIRLRDNNLCQPCFKQGRLREADSVDHIQPKSQGGDDRESNLQSICNCCHKAKTATERLQ